MSGALLLPYAALALFAVEGLFMLLAPRRFAALMLWQFRLIGARPAEPGPGTFLFYRIFGAALCAVVALILIQFVTE